MGSILPETIMVLQQAQPQQQNIQSTNNNNTNLTVPIVLTKTNSNNSSQNSPGQKSNIGENGILPHSTLTE